jgi:hypothetical protein
MTKPFIHPSPAKSKTTRKQWRDAFEKGWDTMGNESATAETLKNIKDSNPKDAVGVLKAGISNVPTMPLMELAVAMTEGAMKYGRHNYRAIGVRASVYVDAIARHLFAFWEGEDIDTASGIPHIVKIMACCVVLRDAQLAGKYFDDRPPRTVVPETFFADLEKAVKDLAKRYPKPVSPYTELGKDK